MKVVIMAGGKGTRISSVASDIPKPMIKIEGIPVLEREIKCLKDQGFDDIILPRQSYCPCFIQSNPVYPAMMFSLSVRLLNRTLSVYESC